jgi:hypothetical protein
MVTGINELVAEIRRLEDELEMRWEALRQQFQYTLDGHKVRFAAGVRRLHRRYRIGILRYIRETPLAHILTAPVIYAMILPLVILDITLFVYQQVCFRAYRVPRVARGDYLAIDRHQLGYLNGIEKLNCVYCGYGNGLMAMAQEIIARTEQYWCPIKHARRVHGAHQRYPAFADYGDAQSYRDKLEKLRGELRAEKRDSV